jgi:hypothetical protein
MTYGGDSRHPDDCPTTQTLESTTYNKTDQVILLAAPHKAEKITKSIMAIYSSGFLPTISETRPFTGASKVIASVYA